MFEDFLNVARAIKKALLGTRELEFAGRRLRVVYESRGAWQEDEYPVLRQLAAGKRCVFDVGANKGITTLMMLYSMTGTGIVYAFEASSAACDIIRGNAELNGVSARIRVIDAVVCASSGRVVEFFCDGASVFNTTVSGTRLLPVEWAPSLVLKPTISIDDVVSCTGAIPDFIKIDVEGGELAVLKGMTATLRDVRPLVLVEIHRLPAMSVSDHTRTIAALAEEARYRVLPVNGETALTDTSGLLDVRYRTHAVLVPQEAASPLGISPQVCSSDWR